jgi:hypothetical protein
VHLGKVGFDKKVGDKGQTQTEQGCKKLFRPAILFVVRERREDPDLFS